MSCYLKPLKTYLIKRKLGIKKTFLDKRLAAFNLRDLVMAGVAQLVRASGCGSEGRGFDPHHSPHLLLEQFCARSSIG